MGPQPQQVSGKGPIGGQQRLDAAGSHDVGNSQQAGKVVDGQAEHSQDPVSAVGEGEALLLGQHQGFDARRRQGLGPADRASAVGEHLAFPDQHERCMSERRKVAAGPQRAVLWYHGNQARIDQAHQRLRHLRSRPRDAEGERAGPQEHHGPHHLGLDRRSHPGGMGPDQRLLQGSATISGNGGVG